MRNSQSPSIYSIYNNALPYYLDRIDISTISDEGESFAVNFMNQLLKGQISDQFDVSNTVIERIRHLYFESKNLAKTIGAKTFGLGYPLLIDTFEGELLVAPLYIWHISLEPAQTKVDAWVIKFDKDHFIQPNFQVIQYLKEKYDLDYKEKLEEAIVGGIISKAKLEAVCRDLADRFQFTYYLDQNLVIEAPGINEIGDFSHQGAIHKSGILGIYPPQQLKARENLSKPEDVFVPAAEEIRDADPLVFPFLAADPEQVTALEHVVKKNISVVEGVDALGKTQTLLNVLLTALMQEKKCLIVSERAPALKKNQVLLAKSGVNQLNFLLTDPLNDRGQILELLRLAAKGTDRDIPFNKQDFQFKKNRFLRSKERLENAYQATRNNVFGDHAWTDTVGLFLKNNRIEGKELLASHLNRQDFAFNLKEYQSLKTGVENCFPSFQKIKTLKHPLSNLHDRVFQQVSPESGRAYAEEQLSIFLGRARQLHHRYISEIENYRHKLQSHYESYIADLEGHYNTVHEKILGYSDQLGNSFKEARASSFKFPWFYSKHKKKVVAAQNDVAKHYWALKNSFEKNPYFDFQFGSAKEGMAIEEVVQNLEAFDHEFSIWKNKLGNIIQEDAVRLNSKTAHPSLGIKEEVTQLEYALDVLLEELNEAKLYQAHLENKTLTVPQRQKYLEGIIEQMEQTQLNLRDFPLFYQWQSNWLKLTPIGKKVVKALVKVKPGNWSAAFESWYFNNLLTGLQSNSLPTDHEIVEDYDNSWHSLKPLVLNYIHLLWQERQIEGLKNLKRSNKSKYRLIFGSSLLKKQAALSLSDIFEDSVETITDFLPILFVTPHVAMNIIPKGFKFDLIIYEEANRSSIEPSTEIAELGKQVVIFGSNDSNGNETSLLQYALENGVPSVKITNRYEAPIQNLPVSDLPKHTFYYAQESYVENLEGRFHEMEGINDFEAQHIIRLLNRIKQTPQRVYPSVGIVAFTIEQRDLISSYLLKLKQQNAVGSEKIRHLERNGMGVYSIEELFGQHFDILIVSCTYGAINAKGKLTKKTALLNTLEGVSFLQLLINKPLQQLFVLHSFSDEQLETFKGKQWEKGTWLLAHFISMSEAAQQKNELKFLEELESIGKKEQRTIKDPNFVEEIAESLTSYIDRDRFSLHVPWEDVVLPLVVAPQNKGGKKIIVVPDGFFADTLHTSGVWEQAHVNKLKAENFELIPVWSLNFLKDPIYEARKLASQILKQDSKVREAKQLDAALDGSEDKIDSNTQREINGDDV